MADGKEQNSAAVDQCSAKKTFLRKDRVESEHDDAARPVGPEDQDTFESKLGRRLSVASVSSLVEAQGEQTSKDSAELPAKLMKAIEGTHASDEALFATNPTDQLKEEIQGIRTQFFLEKVMVLCSKSNYADAVELLSKPCVLESKLLLPRLLLAECHMHLGNLRTAAVHIDAVRTVVFAAKLGHEEIRKSADNFLADSLYCRAIILYRIASDIIDPSVSVPHLLLGMYLCISKIDDATRPMIAGGGKSREIGIMYGVRFMIEMFNLLRAVEKVTFHYSGELEAYSSACIVRNFYLMGAYKKGVEYSKIGVSALQRQFGPSACKFFIYGRLSRQIGVGLFNMEEFSEAESYFVEAIDACRRVTDYSDDLGLVEILKSELKKTRIKLGKIVPSETDV